MRILQLDLAAFGPFTGTLLDLSQGRFGLHLIYGPNEAGKSSTLRALRQVLYGIDRQTTDDFRVPYRKLRLGATLQNQKGDVLSFVRIKKDKNPLRNLSDELLPDDSLEPFLGHIDEATFTRQFGLDWQSLKEGGEEMVRSEGELARILFAAGSGLTALTQVQEGIEKEMRELFLPTGTIPKINELLEKHKAIEEQLRQVRLSSQEWKKHREALEEAKRSQQELAERKKSLERNRNRLERIQSAKRPIQKFRETQRELKELTNAVLLPKDFSDRRQRVRDQLLKARQSYVTLQADIARLTEQMQSISVNHTILDHAAEIESLYKEIEKYLSSVQDCPQINSKREAAENEARDLLKNIRCDVPLERADDLRVAGEDRALIRELGPDYKALLDRVDAARREAEETKAQLAELLNRQANQREVPEPSALKSALKRATQRGPLEEELAEKKVEIAKAEVLAQKDCQRMPFWSGTLEELEKIKVPFRETLVTFQARFDANSKQRESIEQEANRARAELRDNADDFERLELDGEVPTEEDLLEARALRDQAWQFVLHCWREGGQPTKDQERFLKSAGDSDLAAAYQKAVARADQLSDRLRKEAQRVNEKKRLLADRKKLEAQLPRLESQIAYCETERAEIENEWRALWTPLSINPGTPGEMLEWLQSHLQLMTTVKGLHPQRIYADRLGDLIEEHRRHLIAVLRDVCPSSENLEELTLRELIERSQALLEEIGETQSQRDRLAEDIQKVRQSLPKHEQEVQDAEARLNAWQTQWAKQMAKLGLSAEATPGQANSILDTLDRLFERLHDERELAIRVRSMRDFNQQFEDRVEKTMKALEWDAGDASPTQVVSQLHTELNNVRRAANKLKDLKNEQERQERDIELCKRQIEQSEAALREMCKEAGCSDPDELPRAEENSARKQQLELAEREAREQILQFIADASFEEFLSQADAEDADAIGGQLADLEREIDAIEKALREQIERTAQERNLLESKSGGSQAAVAAEEKQQILAEISTHLERYVQLRLALEAIKEGAERYRKKHQGPVLKRASELFSKLTCGSFLRLQNDGDNNGRPHLVGIRRHEGQEESVELKAMSDGTADQLYLALRIASLEDWLDHHPPVPFILDDILINFDDKRAAAALEVLAELSQRTQVIFFTHHQHLVDLAEAHLPGDLCFHHHLGQAKPRRKKKPLPVKDPGAATLF